MSAPLEFTAKAIGERMRTQDNHCTRAPLYVVQKRRRITGLDPRFSDDIAWWNAGDMREADADEHEKLEAAYQDTLEEPEGWTRSAYMDTWEFVTCCFTEAAAKAFIARNAHRLGEARVFVDSLFRNEEMLAVQKMLAEGVLT